MSDKPEVNVL